MLRARVAKHGDKQDGEKQRVEERSEASSTGVK